MEHVSIKYGNRTILKDLDWEVRNGEKWGVVRSERGWQIDLLSLIYADNPQSYANTLYLFDRKPLAVRVIFIQDIVYPVIQRDINSISGFLLLLV